ncbi:MULTISPECIES: glycosyltransferase family 4 protein [Olivibacter]|uniref:Glycosyltransferase family 4 protein n=1 Tax=Olivibacter jilunii TaxID=985016 RepID=A0ABW6B8T7_9SPHI|nr:glycosyltransferase family 4 protein [Olivibacter sp. UJ_SKK_5.1]MDX3912664.1 glycosyltransferase family 4 protein [Pseudosphingobacterium sp.]
MKRRQSEKKILHVVSVSFSLTYFIGDQFDHFRDKGWDMHVVCSQSAHFNDYAAEKKFTPHPIAINRKISPLADIKAIFKLRKLIRDERIEVVFGHTPKGGLIAMVAAFLAGVKKRVYVRHGLVYETSKGLKRTLLKSIERITGYMAQRVVCVSPSILTISNQEHLSDKKKNVVLGKGTFNGIDTRLKFNPDQLDSTNIMKLRGQHNIQNQDIVIGFVGRIAVDKGIGVLLEAWKLLKARYRDIKLVLIGPFDERDNIDDQLQDMIRLDEDIISTGHIEDTRNYYGLLDVFVLPSYREGLPTVILEASSLCVPVVATKVTGCVDAVLTGYTGFLTEHDPVEIANVIAYYIDNPRLRLEHGKNGRNFVVQHFDQRDMWKRIEDTFLY